MTNEAETGQLQMLNEVWEHKKAAGRAWTRQMAALHRMIGDPANAEEYERKALVASDELTEANKQADIVLHAMSRRYPPQTIEVPDAGAWRPILTMLGLLREKEPEPTP
jgi:hypothetical protein